MDENTHYSQEVPAFHGRALPEKGAVVGYAAIIETLDLTVPIPDIIAIISIKNKRYEVPGWRVFTPKYQPGEDLYKQLVFALKYESVNLLLFKKLFEKLSEKEVTDLLQIEPTGQYTRRIWFLYEWLMDRKLDLPDLTIKKSVPLLDPKQQYVIEGKSSPRHRIINNLPGTRNFCPLIRRTKVLDEYVAADYSSQKEDYIKGIRKNVLQRASAFLLLKDSKASFTIEGESPRGKRAARWGQAIGQAGQQPLTKEELLRLQQLVIENSLFVEMGFRKKGGFVGQHDRTTGEPIPEHISARWQDVETLIQGLIELNERLMDTEIDAVLMATKIAFGFVFIHPFIDGNGRIHRYIIHHILARKGFSKQGIIFPISAAILDKIGDYRKALESYSHPLLDFIEWKTTKDHNVEVLNDTIDYYRYFDATKQAEFLYSCVRETIETIIPEELRYLQHYDEFKRYIDDEFEMPDKTVAQLVRFLEQNDGVLSKRARDNEFAALKEDEAERIESAYGRIFAEE